MAIPVLWRTKRARYTLQSEVCPECERLVFPPRQLCPYCGEPSHIMREKTDAARGAFAFPVWDTPALQSATMQPAGDD